MNTNSNNWKREGTITSDVNTSSLNPVEATVELRNGIFEWSLHVGSSRHRQNSSASLEAVTRAVELAVTELVNGEDNVSDASETTVTPAPLFFKIKWASDWIALDAS